MYVLLNKKCGIPRHVESGRIVGSINNPILFSGYSGRIRTALTDYSFVKGPPFPILRDLIVKDQESLFKPWGYADIHEYLDRLDTLLSSGHQWWV